MLNEELDFIEVDIHNFRVLIRPFASLPFKTMMPIIDLSTKTPDSPEVFAMLVKVFTDNLPVDKVQEFENCTMQEAIDIVGEWMNKT